MENKAYYYIFLTRDGYTTLPNLENEESNIENMQYLGDLESDMINIRDALNAFLDNHTYITDEYRIEDIVIKRFPNEVKTFYILN